MTFRIRAACVVVATTIIGVGQLRGADGIHCDAMASSQEENVADPGSLCCEKSVDCGCTCCNGCPDPWLVSREALFSDSCLAGLINLDGLTNLGGQD